MHRNKKYKVDTSNQKSANKRLKICERMEKVERSSDDPLPYPLVLWIIIVRKKN